MTRIDIKINNRNNNPNFYKIISSHKHIDNNLTHTVTQNTILLRKNKTDNECGSYILPPLKEFHPQNSNPKFGPS